MARPQGGLWHVWGSGLGGSSISAAESAPRQLASLPNGLRRSKGQVRARARCRAIVRLIVVQRGERLAAIKVKLGVGHRQREQRLEENAPRIPRRAREVRREELIVIERCRHCNALRARVPPLGTPGDRAAQHASPGVPDTPGRHRRPGRVILPAAARRALYVHLAAGFDWKHSSGCFCWPTSPPP